MSALALSHSTSENLKQRRCNTYNIIFDSIETLNARNRMEHSKAKDSLADRYFSKGL